MTNILSPSLTNFTSSSIIKSSTTPVILNSTFLLKSPFSYPKIVSFALISSDVLIPTPIPVQPKNWFIDLEVYSIVLGPLIKVPVAPNPIVESTEIIGDPAGAASSDFVNPGIVNVPWIKSRSLNPTNSEIL